MRHAPAEARAPHSSDQSRALSPEGVDKCRRIAAGMKALKLVFDVVLSSPLLRARQTAEIVCERLSEKPSLKIVKELSPGADPNRVIQMLSTEYRNSASLLLVGHKPDLGELASVLLVSTKAAAIHFKKGSICKLTLPPPVFERNAILEWLLTPGHLTRLH